MQAQSIRAAIYARVSTEEQGRGYSLDTQIEGARQHAAERGYTVVGVFEDRHSGEELDRPGLAALYAAIPIEHIDTVIFHALDRLGRTLAVQAIIERELELAGVRVEYVLGDYGDGPEGIILKAVKGAIAQVENLDRTERSRRGKAGKARAGFVLPFGHRAPYGYTYVPAPHAGEFVVNEAEARIVRQIFAWVTVERLSSYTIATRLSKAGVPTRGDESPSVAKPKAGYAEWSANTVRNIIRSTVYRGEWRYGTARWTKRGGKRIATPTPPDQWVSVSVPPIVDAETWDRAQVCLSEGKARSPRNVKRDYLLRGMVICPCGRRWSGRFHNGMNAGYYRCGSDTDAPKPCPYRRAIRQDKLEPAVWRAVMDEFRKQERVEAEIERQRAAAADEVEKRDARLRAIDAAIRDVDRRLEALLVQALDGYPAAIIDRQKRAHLAQRADLEAQREQVTLEAQQSEISEHTISAVRELASLVREAEPALTWAERRQLLELLRLRVDVLDPTRVRLSGLITSTILTLASGSCSCSKTATAASAARRRQSPPGS
jgi:site-specific DNA recombinase